MNAENAENAAGKLTTENTDEHRDAKQGKFGTADERR
jgi:hypothetical protein